MSTRPPKHVFTLLQTPPLPGTHTLLHAHQHDGCAHRMLSRYREDPMMSLPKWLLSYIMDKQLPKGCEAMLVAAKDCERLRKEQPRS